MALTLSHTKGPSEPPLRDITLGELLAWAAQTTPERACSSSCRSPPITSPGASA